MIKYGLISETDARTIEKTIDLICNEFPNDVIEVIEVGIYDGQTARGMADYIFSKGRNVRYAGVDNQKDKNVLIPFDGAKVIIGNSSEVYNQIENNSQHLIFVDGDHSYIGVISDFFAYCDKVKVGGYFCFHDTGKHIAPFTDFQHGDKENPDAYISVRKALNKIGLLPPFVNIVQEYHNRIRRYYGWELIFDEADETNEAGGICVFKKLF